MHKMCSDRADEQSESNLIDCCTAVAAGYDEFDQLSTNDSGSNEIQQNKIEADCTYDDEVYRTSIANNMSIANDADKFANPSMDIDDKSFCILVPELTT